VGKGALSLEEVLDLARDVVSVRVFSVSSILLFGMAFFLPAT
jgi:hypothetical protein